MVHKFRSTFYSIISNSKKIKGLNITVYRDGGARRWARRNPGRISQKQEYIAYKKRDAYLRFVRKKKMEKPVKS